MGECIVRVGVGVWVAAATCVVKPSLVFVHMLYTYCIVVNKLHFMSSLKVSFLAFT